MGSIYLGENRELKMLGWKEKLSIRVSQQAEDLEDMQSVRVQGRKEPEAEGREYPAYLVVQHWGRRLD